MFSALRKQVTPATIVALMALVFALTGGAFAASGGGGGASPAKPNVSVGSTVALATLAKSKAKAKVGPRGPAGPAGKAGASGAQGPVGPAGAQGAQGTAGAAGAKGETGPQGPEGKAGKPGANGENGENGTTGFTDTLPAGKIETGTWAVRGTVKTEGEKLVTAISFPIPLSAPASIEYIESSTNPQFECPGGVEKPQAEPRVLAPGVTEGILCVYAGKALLGQEGLEGPLFIKPAGGAGPTETTGVEMVFTATKKVGEEVSAEGTWAVTGEAEG